MENRKHRIKNHMLKHIRLWSFVLILLAAWIISAGMQEAKASALQKGISRKVMRFHVLANSDSDADQRVKMMVRDGVLKWLEGELLLQEEKQNLEEVRLQIEELLPGIEERAEQILSRAGFDYGLRAELKEVYFPERSYGNCTFPAGNYTALRILLGEAKGQNWWCVLFPRLCFLDCVHAVMPEESQKQLQGILTEEEYESLFDPREDEYRICFRYF